MHFLKKTNLKIKTLISLFYFIFTKDQSNCIIQNQGFYERSLVIGTIAKVIYGKALSTPVSDETLREVRRTMIKPKQLVLSNVGMRDKILPDLIAMGIQKKDVVRFFYFLIHFKLLS